MVPFVGIHRRGYQVETPYPVIWVDVPEIDLRFRQDSSKNSTRLFCVRYLVPDKVLDYIQKEGLYQREL